MAVSPDIMALRMPQARVLAALMPEHANDAPVDWPLLTRARLAIRAGFTILSGTTTRALNGVNGNRTIKPHPGLIERGMVTALVLDIEGVKETNYQITALGMQAYQLYTARHGELPVVRDADTCTNDRYRDISEEKSESE